MKIRSVWSDEHSCWTHTFEVDGWKLLVQESGKNEANLLLERGNGSEHVGFVRHSSVQKFISFMERVAK